MYTRFPRVYLQPVLVAGAVLFGVLYALGPSADSAFASGTAPLGWLLAPTVVGFATQLFSRRQELWQGGRRLAFTFLGASVVSLLVAPGVAWLLGASTGTVRSLVPASATSPIAALLAESHGGRGPLAIAACMVIGLAGAALAPFARRLPDEAYGASLGVSAHGIGTGTAIERSDAAGASASLALVVQGLLVALLAPLAYWLADWMGL
jgi:putative effector of murein hydrolase